MIFFNIKFKNNYKFNSDREISSISLKNNSFTFTILYGIFVVFQSINYFVDSSLTDYSLISTINTIVDIVVAFVFLIITLVFKIDDWKPYRKESK